LEAAGVLSHDEFLQRRVRVRRADEERLPLHRVGVRFQHGEYPAAKCVPPIELRDVVAVLYCGKIFKLHAEE
jgi:hypothetical protein